MRGAVGDLGPFPAPLALNVVPWAGSLKDAGWSSEELKIRNESRKILGLPELRVNATCVRVPVVTTHSVAVHARFARPVDREAAWEVLRDAPGVVLSDDPANGEFPTPADVVGTDPTWVGRVRRVDGRAARLELFVCGEREVPISRDETGHCIANTDDLYRFVSRRLPPLILSDG